MLMPAIQPVSYFGSRSQECGCPLLPVFSDCGDFWLNDRIIHCHMSIHMFMQAEGKAGRHPDSDCPYTPLNVVDSVVSYIQCVLAVPAQIEPVIDTSAISIAATIPHPTGGRSCRTRCRLVCRGCSRSATSSPG